MGPCSKVTSWPERDSVAGIKYSTLWPLYFTAWYYTLALASNLAINKRYLGEEEAYINYPSGADASTSLEIGPRTDSFPTALKISVAQ